MQSKSKTDLLLFYHFEWPVTSLKVTMVSLEKSRYRLKNTMRWTFIFDKLQLGWCSLGPGHMVFEQPHCMV